MFLEIDENCEYGECGPNSECVNTTGIATCQCKPGDYKVNDDKEGCGKYRES